MNNLKILQGKSILIITKQIMESNNIKLPIKLPTKKSKKKLTPLNIYTLGNLKWDKYDKNKTI